MNGLWAIQIACTPMNPKTQMQGKKMTSTILYQNVAECVFWSFFPCFPSLVSHYEGLKLVFHTSVSLCLFVPASPQTFAKHLEPKIKMKLLNTSGIRPVIP